MTTGRLFGYTLKKGITKYGYTLTITPADPLTGKYPQVTKKGFASERAAKSAMLIHIKTVGDENIGKSRTLTVQDWNREWLHEVTPHLRPWSERTYRHTIEHYLIPQIGLLPLTKLAPNHIDRMYQHLETKLKPVTVHRIHRTLRTCLLYAIKKGHLDKSSLERVTPPDRRSPRRGTLSVSDARHMLSGSKSTSQLRIWLHFSPFTQERAKVKWLVCNGMISISTILSSE